MTPGFTAFHSIISLVALVAGIVLSGRLASRGRTTGWTALFFSTAALTSVTGFIFLAPHILPSHIIGAVALASLIPTALGYGAYRQAGRWGLVYRLGVIFNTYLLAFVALFQAFTKIDVLKSGGTGPAGPLFIAAQTILLMGAPWIGYASVRRTARRSAAY